MNSKKILDLGCGTGDITNEIAKVARNSISILGIDIAKDFIEYCNSQKLDKRIKFATQDAVAPWPKDWLFDTVSPLPSSTYNHTGSDRCSPYPMFAVSGVLRPDVLRYRCSPIFKEGSMFPQSKAVPMFPVSGVFRPIVPTTPNDIYGERGRGNPNILLYTRYV